MEKVFDFKEVPTDWRLCFNEKCPLRERCLRFLAGLHVPADLITGPAVYPTALKDGACRYFVETRVVQKARGFDNFFREVKQKDAATMREALEEYLGGHGTYYRYKRGEKLLSERQQAWIRRLFKRYGYDMEISFKEHVMVYDFGNH